ncbi:MAG: peroxiredoxin [Thermoplasmata archaeon]
MIAVGDAAPDFEAQLQDGTPFRLSSTRGHPTVLYFYPKADTPGCTIEAQGFRDHYAEFQAAGVSIVGVSTDTCEEQLAFAKKYGLPFSLVADKDKKVGAAYGVLAPAGYARRISFLIGADGTVAEVVTASSAPTHVDRARARYLKA